KSQFFVLETFCLYGESGLALRDDIEDQFAAAVKGALDSVAPTDGNDCPSAEVIAAYYERSLNEEERARCEKHYSECERCQETLAALLRAAPDVELPPEAAQASHDSVVPPIAPVSRVGLRWLRTGWEFTMPAAAAA